MKQKRQLAKFDKKKKEKIKEAIKLIAKYPFKGKKLKGKLEGLRSYRVGIYRIIYQITEDGIEIISIAHRKDAY
ncbi:MAG: type II toxin-antitoxin system mRNA interferase toxin, RelE/StbE family [Candidatus Desantisbacteria bacterium]